MGKNGKLPASGCRLPQENPPRRLLTANGQQLVVHHGAVGAEVPGARVKNMWGHRTPLGLPVPTVAFKGIPAFFLGPNWATRKKEEYFAGKTRCSSTNGLKTQKGNLEGMTPINPLLLPAVCPLIFNMCNACRHLVPSCAKTFAIHSRNTGMMSSSIWR